MSDCCITKKPCTVDPCAGCPEHPVVNFHAWLDAYGTKESYDRGDMAACWYAAQRAAMAEKDRQIEELRLALKVGVR